MEDLLTFNQSTIAPRHYYCKYKGVLFVPGKDNNQGQANSQGEASQVNGLQTEELTQLREEVEDLRQQLTLLRTQLSDKDALINTLVSMCECM